MKLPHHYAPFIALLFFAGCGKPKTQAPVTTSSDYQKGEAFLNQHTDSAFYYFNQAAIGSDDSLLRAMAYNKMAIIQSDAGDYFGSQENLLVSMRFLDQNNERDRYCLFSNYNELGITSLNLKNYDAAIQYFNQVLKYLDNDDYKRITLNNKALAYQRKGDYEQALAIYDSIIEPNKKDKIEYARVLSNFARTKWLQNNRYPAAPELHAALHIRQSEKNDWGLNASFGHLSDYYASSRPDSALNYAKKLLEVSRKLGSPDDEMDALKRIIRFGSSESEKLSFQRYTELNDSLQTSRNNAKNQFALIRYEAEKHKTDNLILQKENAEKKLRIVWQQAILAAIITLAIAGFLWYRKRKQQTLREQQLRTSQKVHDVVANGLYRLMAKLEHDPQIKKEHLLDEMETLYDQSRDISYEAPEKVVRGYKEKIAVLLKSFSTPDTLVSIVGNSTEWWNPLPSHYKDELYHVLQELMVNMKKHSGAKNVVVRFEQEGKEAVIKYMDDGIGLPQPFHHGNGWKNTETRINRIGGRIIFDPPTEESLAIKIIVPFP